VAVAMPAPGRILLSWGTALTQAVNDLLAADILLAANRPTFHIRHGLSQNFGSGQWTWVDFNLVEIDSHGGYDAAHPARYTAKVRGWYRLSGGIGWWEQTGGYRGIRWHKNENILDSGEASQPFINGQASMTARTTMVALNVGDWVALQAMQGSGQTRPSIGGGPHGASMTVEYVRPI
jgi:hypothetical protein